MRGQALVEAAIALPLLLLVIVGGLHLGLMVVDRTRLIHAAQQGALTGDCTEATNVAQAVYGSTLEVAECSEADGLVEVRLVNEFAPLAPFLPNSIEVIERAAVGEPDGTPSPTADLP